jgi:hypothetical protein
MVSAGLAAQFVALVIIVSYENLNQVFISLKLYQLGYFLWTSYFNFIDLLIQHRSHKSCLSLTESPYPVPRAV